MTNESANAIDHLRHTFAAGDFTSAAASATAMIAEAAAGDPLDRLVDALLGTPGLQPLFRNTAELLASEPFFASVYAALEHRRGSEDLRVARYRTRVAAIASGRGDYETAAALLTTSLTTITRQLGPHDAKTMLVRSNLAIQHRNANHPERADALFADVTLCDHLRPLVDELRSRGLHVLDVTRPWSDNCRAWMYVADVVLDVDALKTRLHLPAVVEVHRHRGTVDGAEQGLVCTIDHDGVMGLHPDVAPKGAKTIS